MPARLVSLTDEPSILIDKPILLIGRHPECDIQIDSRKISRRHCCIAQVADYLVVRDLASTNGVRINGVRVLEGRLKDNDELMIGALRYRVSWDIPPELPQRPGQDVHEVAPPRRSSPPIAADEDAVLEACDEPVALADPGSAQPRQAPEQAPATSSQAAPPRQNGAAESPPARRAAPSSSQIIPEQLNLAPPSGTN